MPNISFILILVYVSNIVKSGPSLSPWQYVVDVEHGNDSNSGKGVEDAFQTIARCVEAVRVEGGDCLVREGRYREVLTLEGVRPTQRGVRILGYGDERPVWDGTYQIHPDSWRLDLPAGACTATIPTDIFALFLDDDLLTAARWPNALWSNKTVFLATHWRQEQKGSDRGTVVDKSLAESGLDMTGAMAILNIGSWTTHVARVESHEKGSDRFLYNDTFGNIHYIWSHSRYYLEGSLALLDAPEEWIYQRDTKQLHVIPPQGKTCEDLSNLRGRTVDYGLTITDSKNITVANFTFFGANIDIHGSRHAAAKDIHLDTIHFLFPSSSHRMLGSASAPKHTRIYSDRHEHGAVSVTNCIFHGAEGPALNIEATNSIVTNNLFTYNDWVAQGNVATVWSRSHDGEFSHNTLSYNGANSGFYYVGMRDEIKMNHLEGTCWGSIQNDGAQIQLQIGPQDGSNIHHNWIHDSPKKGIRFDSPAGSTHYGYHGYIGYNVGWSSADAEIAPKGDNHTVEHNTAYDTNTKCSLCVYPKLFNIEMNMHTVVTNNAATVMAGGGGLIKDNYEGRDLTDHLVDAANFDFRPLPGSPLDLPDGSYSGAYRRGEDSYWIPGYKTAQASKPIPRDGGALRLGRVEEEALICLLGYRAITHLFYLGVDRESVAEAGIGSDEFQFSTEGEANLFYLGMTDLVIEEGREYFWRVDSQRADGGITKGEVWAFHALAA